LVFLQNRRASSFLFWHFGVGLETFLDHAGAVVFALIRCRVWTGAGDGIVGDDAIVVVENVERNIELRTRNP